MVVEHLDDGLVVAAFDVDGTLTTRDCVVPFLVEVAGRRRVVTASLRHPWLLAATAMGRGGDRDRLKAAVVGRLVRGRRRETLDELGRRYCEHVTRSWLRPDTLARLRWHRARGHRIVLVSASLRHYLEPLAQSIGGVDAVLCTDVETATDGTCTGRLAEGNCRGPEKARRLSAWLGGRRATVWAYGDSAGDAELLAMADHAVRVKGVAVSEAPDDWAA